MYSSSIRIYQKIIRCGKMFTSAKCNADEIHRNREENIENGNKSCAGSGG